MASVPAPAPAKPLTKAQAEAKAKAEAETKANVEAEAKAKAEADAKLKAEADAKAKVEAEAKRKADWVKGLHLFAIFVTTIVGIILKALPMGAVAMIGIAVTALSGTLSIADSMSGFSDVVIWLIVLAFFISRGFIKTGLGARIAYTFMALLGQAHPGPQLRPGRHGPGAGARHSQQHGPGWRHRHAHHGLAGPRLRQQPGRRRVPGRWARSSRSRPTR